MAVYCASCGHRQEQAMPFCPACGRRMGGDAAAAPYDSPIRRARNERRHGGGVGKFLLVAFLLLTLAGAAFVQAGRAPTCQAALNGVEQHHLVVFNLMEGFGVDPAFRCDGLAAINPFTAQRSVHTLWAYQGRAYDAVYEVDDIGTVAPANLTAASLDRAASEGSAAVLGLFGR